MLLVVPLSWFYVYLDFCGAWYCFVLKCNLVNVKGGIIFFYHEFDMMYQIENHLKLQLENPKRIWDTTMLNL